MSVRRAHAACAAAPSRVPSFAPMTVPATAADATRRTRLANERTFLAWWRTALGAEGLAVVTGKLVPEVTEGAGWPSWGSARCWRCSAGRWRLPAGGGMRPSSTRSAAGRRPRRRGWLMAVMGGVLGVMGLAFAVLLLVA